MQSGDWLESHPEPGQTYKQYLKSRPVLAEAPRRAIVIQPIGPFEGGASRLLDLTEEFMGIYFGLPVRVEKNLPVDKSWPPEAQRVHPHWGDHQLLTPYILDDVLKPKLPDDAATYLGLTAMDLWPGEGWNFVFGQASTRHRVGVWSIYRSGETDGSKKDFALALLRTIKTATHETAHMFSMLHCTAYECNMCGSNNRAESDRHPLWLCPECLQKLITATGVDPATRFEKLIAFCEKNGLAEEARFYEKSLAAVK